MEKLSFMNAHLRISTTGLIMLCHAEEEVEVKRFVERETLFLCLRLLHVMEEDGKMNECT
jgi:hypothetical protein